MAEVYRHCPHLQRKSSDREGDRSLWGYSSVGVDGVGIDGAELDPVGGESRAHSVDELCVASSLSRLRLLRERQGHVGIQVGDFDVKVAVVELGSKKY